MNQRNNDKNQTVISRKPRSLIVSFVIGVFVFLTVMALIVAGLEIYYRGKEKKLNPFPIKGLYQPDQYTLFGLIPNLKNKEYRVVGEKKFYVNINEDALRGPLYPKEKDPGAFRVLALGSSFTFGWGVNDDATWSAELEKELNRNKLFDYERAEVINAGLPGTHGDIVIRRYLAKGRAYNPDLVVVVTQPEAPHQEIRNMDTEEWHRPDPEFLQKSAYYIDEEGVLKTYVTDNPFWKKWAARSALVKHVLLRLRTKGNNDYLRAYWDSIREQPDEALLPIMALRRILKEDGVPMVVLIRHWATQFNEYPTPQDIMTQKLNERGIPTTNLRPLFEPYENERRYLVDDGHWNERGHELVAEEAYKLIEKNYADKN